jgi:hypothetical protein
VQTVEESLQGWQDIAQVPMGVTAGPLQLGWDSGKQPVVCSPGDVDQFSLCT